MDVPSLSFKDKYFPDSDWYSWSWQLGNSFRDIKSISRIVELSDDEKKALSDITNPFPIAITPYYASLIHPTDTTDPIRRMVIPVTQELYWSKGEEDDPLCEDKYLVNPNLVHKYPDRVLFLTTNNCSNFCRYCTRSRRVGKPDVISFEHWNESIHYIKDHKEVRDVLLSGGDPLMLSDDNLEWIISRVKAIPHVEFIRIGSKIPVVLPQRITSTLCNILKKYHPLWMNIHFSHPSEITPEVIKACNMLADAGIPLGSQTVLLKGINDNIEIMKSLMQKLLTIRVRPYYLYTADRTSGTKHFRTSIQTGLDIIKGLRGFTTGLCCPALVVDSPGGKIPVLPEYYKNEDGKLTLIDFKGNKHDFSEVTE
jgi:lysine 2,3-aminomutase